MSWHGPSAPRVEGIATKSRVVASWASNPASTASRIFLVWSAFMVVIVPVPRRSNHTSDPICRRFAFQNRTRIPTVAVMMVSRILPCFCFLLLGTSTAALAMNDQVAREQDIVGLRLGQRVLVDDGSCGAGQIKEVSGAKMTPTGVLASRRCIPRSGPKKK